MSEKSDATFFIALLILTIVGLVVSSATHAGELISSGLPLG